MKSARVRLRATDLLEALRHRRSSRGGYDSERGISKADIHRILEAARWAPTAHNMQNFQIVVVQDEQTLSAIAAIPSLPTEAFLRENAAQLSVSEAELRERKAGLLATSFPISWRSPDAQPIHTSDSDHAFIGSAMKDCPALLVVAYDSRTRAPGSEGDMLGMMSLGCVMQNMWLMADALGISTQILSVLSSDAAERKLRTILKLPIFYRIAFGCRLGYQKPSREKYLRVRRDIGDFAHAGQFGNRSLQ